MLIYLPSGRRELNVKAVVAAFNHERALVGGAFSLIIQLQSSRMFVSCSTWDWMLGGRK